MSDDLRNSIECRETNIRHYFPDVLANAVEFNEFANVVEPELNRVIKLLIEKALDTFVFDLDEDGAGRWEKMLKLSSRNADTLDDRRMAILAKIMPNTPYTHRKLEILLDEICGEGNYSINLKHSQYYIKILIALGVKRQRQTAEYMLRCILPANLTIEIDLMYNRHIDLKRFTHGRMKEWMYTHHDLRAEVLADA